MFRAVAVLTQLSIDNELVRNSFRPAIVTRLTPIQRMMKVKTVKKKHLKTTITKQQPNVCIASTRVRRVNVLTTFSIFIACKEIMSLEYSDF
jgi:hypothetical protein